MTQRPTPSNYLAPVAAEVAALENDAVLKRRLYASWIERGIKQHIAVWLVDLGLIAVANVVRLLPPLLDSNIDVYLRVLDDTEVELAKVFRSLPPTATARGELRRLRAHWGREVTLPILAFNAAQIAVVARRFEEEQLLQVRDIEAAYLDGKGVVHAPIRIVDD